jgi:hypothetical protein
MRVNIIHCTNTMFGLRIQGQLFVVHCFRFANLRLVFTLETDF